MRASLRVRVLFERASLRDPFSIRACRSDASGRESQPIIANTAEGAGEFSPPEKARFYRMARRSAIEVVAWLEITQRRGEAASQLIDDALTHLEAVVSMLVRLIKRATK